MVDLPNLKNDQRLYTVMFLSFRTDRSGQIVQTQIRLLRVYTVCSSLCIFWMHYSKEKPSCSSFRVITANVRVSEFLGVLWYLLFNTFSFYCKNPRHELPHDKTNKMASLIRVFAVRMKKAWVLSYPLSAREDSDQTGWMPFLLLFFSMI